MSAPRLVQMCRNCSTVTQKVGCRARGMQHRSFIGAALATEHQLRRFICCFVQLKQIRIILKLALFNGHGHEIFLQIT